MKRTKDEAGTFELLLRLPQQIMALLRAEYENAKREIGRQVKKFGIGALFVVIALFFVFFSIGAFVAAAIAGIAVALPVWAAALIVAGGLLLLAGLSIALGVMLVKRGNPVPEQTISRIEGDVNALAEVRFNADQNPPKKVFTGGRDGREA